MIREDKEKGATLAVALPSMLSYDPFQAPMIREYKEKQELEELVVLIREIWREYYTPLIGAEQVEYMLDQFQSVDAIMRQVIHENYRYYCVFCDDEPAGYYAAKPSDVRLQTSDFRLQEATSDVNSEARSPKPEACHRVFLSKLYVAAKFRGRGLGKQMLQHLEEGLRASDFRLQEELPVGVPAASGISPEARSPKPEARVTIWLTVNKHNPSIDIYRKLGFVITEEIVTDIGNGFVMDDYVMEKQLEAGSEE